MFRDIFDDRLSLRAPALLIHLLLLSRSPSLAFGPVAGSGRCWLSCLTDYRETVVHIVNVARARFTARCATTPTSAAEQRAAFRRRGFCGETRTLDPFDNGRQPRILEPAGFIINPQPPSCPPAPDPFRLLRSTRRKGRRCRRHRRSGSFAPCREPPARNTSLIPLIEIYRGSYDRLRRVFRGLANVRGCVSLSLARYLLACLRICV